MRDVKRSRSMTPRRCRPELITACRAELLDRGNAAVEYGKEALKKFTP